ncbi:MAG: hypothetical protein LBI20_02245 [Holosporales bacterium]|jgi:hypothetical protein|nr:hypothetical protein [Holosporales bacterium]
MKTKILYLFCALDFFQVHTTQAVTPLSQGHLMIFAQWCSWQSFRVSDQVMNRNFGLSTRGFRLALSDWAAQQMRRVYHPWEEHELAILDMLLDEYLDVVPSGGTPLTIAELSRGNLHLFPGRSIISLEQKLRDLCISRDAQAVFETVQGPTELPVGPDPLQGRAEFAQDGTSGEGPSAPEVVFEPHGLPPALDFSRADIPNRNLGKAKRVQRMRKIREHRRRLAVELDG